MRSEKCGERSNCWLTKSRLHGSSIKPPSRRNSHGSNANSSLDKPWSNGRPTRFRKDSNSSNSGPNRANSPKKAKLYSVKAPVDGAVIGLEGVFEGSYVQSGQRIGDISPTSDFVIDTLVPPKDIGRISKGQPVNLQIDAYPYTVWGLLPGRVIRISAD